MAADELRFRVTADGADAAAKEVAKVQDAVDRLEGTAAQVTVEAEDEATEVLDEAQTSVDDLDGADAEVSVEADDQATEPLEGAQEAVDSLDGSSATVTAEADDEASDVLADVQGAVAEIDGQSASVEIAADDKASEPIGAVTDKMGGLADAAGSLPGPLGEIGSLLGGLGTGAAGAAAGIGGIVTAIAGLAMKGVNQFKDLAIEVDNFSTRTGASLDASSRFIEVAKDLDIGVGAIESSLGRMNKAAAETPDAFDEIGASLVRNDQGNVDSVETFISVLSALNRMPDASDRAKAGNEIFGKGWQNMSELVGMSADELRVRLQDVSEQKIFDEGKIAQGQGLRDALDTIGDAADDVFIALGETLGPAIAELAPALAEVITALGPVIAQIGELAPIIEAVTPLISGLAEGYGKLAGFEPPSWMGPFGAFIKQFTNPIGALADKINFLKETFGSTAELTGSVGDAFDNLSTATDGTGTSAADAAEATEEYKAVLEGQVEALQANIDKQNELSGTMASYADLMLELPAKSDAFTESLTKYNETAAKTDSTQAEIDKTLRDVVKSAADLAETVVEVTTQQDAMNGATTSATAKLDAQNNSLLSQAATASGPARQSILDYTFALNQIPPEVQSQIIALINQGKLDEANALLADASKNRDALVSAETDNASLNRTNADLDRAARDRQATIFVKTSGAGFMLGSTTSGPSAGTGMVVPAVVTTSADDEVAVSANGRVRITRRAARRTPATQVTNVTNNVIVPRIPSGRELERVSQRWARVNGKG